MNPRKAFLETLKTPSLMVDRDILSSNLGEMAEFAKDQGIDLRPHTKTHKCPELAKRQLSLGACGIAVAKLSEAQLMAASGIKDIKIANQVVDPQKIRELAALSKQCALTIAIDNPKNARMVSSMLMEEDSSVRVLMDIDIGYHRTGVSYTNQKKALALARLLERLPGIEMAGIMTHAGQAYSARNRQELRKIGLLEGKEMVALAAFLRRNDVSCDTVSVGSTPTAMISGKVSGVTEIRPGNYIFKDQTQMSLGVTKPSGCALRVLAMVSSIPSKNRVILDAGSKSLGPEKLPFKRPGIAGCGYLVGKKATLTNLSEEHGFVKRIQPGERFQLGERIEVIPNHACFAVNLYNEIISVPDGHCYQVEGRGCNQ